MTLAAVGLPLTLAAAVLAQGPTGPEIVVNTTTAGDQVDPDVAMAPDGRAVVVWQEPEIRARLFDAAGAPRGNDFQVNANSTGVESEPAVAMRSDGGFLVVWERGPTGVEGRLFDADGLPLTGDLLLAPDGEYPDVDARGDGGFVVVYTDAFQAYGAIRGRRLDALGAAAPAFDIALGSAASSYPFFPHLDIDANDEFAVTWDGAIFSAYGQHFEADGTPGGPVHEIELGSHTDIASDHAGGFAIVSRDRSRHTVELQRIAANGTPLGSSVHLGPSAFDDRLALLRDGSGTLLAASRSVEPSGQFVAADGTRIGGAFAFNQVTGGAQSSVRLSGDGQGLAVATWSSDPNTLDSSRGGAPQDGPGGDPDGFSIRLRRVSVPLFGDGFETGDASRWTATVP